MEKDNYLNIEATARDKYVYRIISFSRLLELLAMKENVLVKPGKWADPFENFIVRSQHAFGQCWTLHSASDAMWRIYSPEANAVRIRSTIRMLAESLTMAGAGTMSGEAFIGRVKYLKNSSLMTFAEDAVSNPSPARAVAKTLLVKRTAFQHEREVRLLFIADDSGSSGRDWFSYSVDPNALVDQIMLDPRMTEQDAKKIKQVIKVTTGFAGIIKRSLLYAPPPHFISEIGKI